MLLLHRSHGNCAQGSFTVNGSKEGCTVLEKGKAESAKETQQQSQLENSQTLCYLTCSMKALLTRTLVTRRKPSSRRSPQATRLQPRCSAITDDTLVNSVFEPYSTLQADSDIRSIQELTEKKCPGCAALASHGKATKTT